MAACGRRHNIGLYNAGNFSENNRPLLTLSIQITLWFTL